MTAIPHHDLALTINITSQVNGFEYTFFSGRYEFNEPPAGSNRKPSVDILGQLPTNFPAGNATVSVFNHYVVGVSIMCLPCGNPAHECLIKTQDNPEGQTEFITVPVVAVN